MANKRGTGGREPLPKSYLSYSEHFWCLEGGGRKKSQMMRERGVSWNYSWKEGKNPFLIRTPCVTDEHGKRKKKESPGLPGGWGKTRTHKKKETPLGYPYLFKAGDLDERKRKGNVYDSQQDP